MINENKDLIKPSQYLFGRGKYKILSSSKRKLALTIAQIKAVIDFPFINETDMMYRDFWFFSFLCNGANMMDLKEAGPISLIFQKAWAILT